MIRLKNLYLLVLGISLISTVTILTACSTQIISPTPEISENPLPQSMKGYEIYSWQEDDQWVFKLITGTNRQKTVEEIITNSETIQDDAWVNIKINGVDALKIILRRLPKGETVFWLTVDQMDNTANQFNSFEFPHDVVIEDIQGLCKQIGVDLIISK